MSKLQSLVKKTQGILGVKYCFEKMVSLTMSKIV
jgi:hypothetical protein